MCLSGCGYFAYLYDCVPFLISLDKTLSFVLNNGGQNRYPRLILYFRGNKHSQFSLC